MRQTDSGVILSVRVKAGSGSFSIVSEGGQITIRTRSPAENNRANQEIVKELSRLFGKEARILKGLKSNKKEIFVEGGSPHEVEILLGRK